MSDLMNVLIRVWWRGNRNESCSFSLNSASLHTDNDDLEHLLLMKRTFLSVHRLWGEAFECHHVVRQSTLSAMNHPIHNSNHVAAWSTLSCTTVSNDLDSSPRVRIGWFDNSSLRNIAKIDADNLRENPLWLMASFQVRCGFRSSSIFWTVVLSRNRPSTSIGRTRRLVFQTEGRWQYIRDNCM